MAVAVVVRYRVREGEEEVVGRALGEMATASRAEPGCLAYHPLQAAEDRRVFLIFESYADEAAFEAHRSTEHFQRLVVDVVRPRAESREVTLCEPLG